MEIQITSVLGSIFFGVIASMLYSFISKEIYGHIDSIKYLLEVTDKRKEVRPAKWGKKVLICIATVGLFFGFLYWLIIVKSWSIEFVLICAECIAFILIIKSEYLSKDSSESSNSFMGIILLTFGLFVISIGVIESLYHVSFNSRAASAIVSTIVLILGVVLCGLSEVIFLAIRMREVVNKKVIMILAHSNKLYIVPEAHRKLYFNNGICTIKVHAGEVVVLSNYSIFAYNANQKHDIDRVKKSSKMKIVEV